MNEIICQVERHDGKPCGRKAEIPGEKKCLFHTPFTWLLDRERFQQELENYIKDVEEDPSKSCYDFTSFNFRVAPFGDKVFRKSVIFKNASFQSGAYFSDAKFQGKADFFGAKFQGEANFGGARFQGKAVYHLAEFQDEADFSGAEFQGRASFGSAKFQGKAHFSGAEFQGRASFSYAKFEGKAYFYSTKFQELTRFSTVTFDRETYFKGDNYNECFMGECDFRQLNSGKEAVVTFEKVNLGKASFLDTNVESIVFRDVEWHSPRPARRKQTLWDEFKSLKKNEKLDFEKIAENYRQLVLNYERKRDYETAENFHIGEMEMRRKRKGQNAKNSFQGKFLRRANAYWLYKRLSYYGTSYWRAVRVFFMALIVCSGVLLYSGFDLSEKNPEDKRGIIKYNISLEYQYSPALFKQWILDYGKAVLLTSSIIAFQRERPYKPVGDISHIWLIISRILLTGQVAMVLLAIRRRFRR